MIGLKLYMFRTVPLSIIRSSSQQWYMSYRFADSLQKLKDILVYSAHCPPNLLKTSTHNTCSITLLIRKLVSRTSNYPERIGRSGQYFRTVIVLHIFCGLKFSPICQIHIRNYVLILYLFVNKHVA